MPSPRVSSRQEYEAFAKDWVSKSPVWQSFNQDPQVRAKKAYYSKRKQAFYRNIGNEILAMVDALFEKGGRTPVILYSDGKSGGFG